MVFDVGETLVDETRAWGVWADWLAVPRLTFMAALGAVIARGGDHREVFELFRPGLDVAAEARRLGVAGKSDLLSLGDLYPDALDCLRALAADGYRLSIAANQPAPAANVLREMAIDFELIATSAAWGVAKPDPAPALHCLKLSGRSRGLFIGDSDTDIRTAAAARMPCLAAEFGYGPLTLAKEAFASFQSYKDLPRLVREALTRSE